MVKPLDGKKLSEKILNNLKRKLKHKRLKLAVIFVGDDSISKIYIREKKQACKKIGIGFELFKFPKNISKLTLEKEIKKIVKNPNNSGIIIQLPLPKELETNYFLNLIPREKDIDVLSSTNISEFFGGTLPIFPPVVAGVKYLLEEYKISLKDKKIVLIGAGRLVGSPLSLWLLSQGINFIVVDKTTKNVPSILKRADIIISGIGESKFITGNMVKRGVIIIDAGTSCDKHGSIGDVDFESVSKKAKYITPVPGGIGPMTVACLLENLIKLRNNFS